MLVPPSGRRAAAAQVVEYELRMAGGNAEMVRRSTARCRELAAQRENWAAFERYTDQLTVLALRNG